MIKHEHFVCARWCKVHSEQDTEKNERRSTITKMTSAAKNLVVKSFHG